MSFEIHSQVEMVIKEEKVECHYRDKRREVETYRDKGRKNEKDIDKGKDDAGDDATRKDSRFTKKKKRKKIRYRTQIRSNGSGGHAPRTVDY